MRLKRLFAGLAGIVAIAATGVLSIALAPAQTPDGTVTMIGEVSDSRCNGEHKPVQDKQGGPANLSNADCTNTCIAAGEKYVFVDTDRNRVYSIENPGEAAKYPGEKVEVVGTLNGSVLKIQKINKKI